MKIDFMHVRNADFQDKHFYLVEIKVRNMKLLTLGKFNERTLTFQYYNYYTNKIDSIDIFETKKLVGVYNIENIIRDIEYFRIFKS